MTDMHGFWLVVSAAVGAMVATVVRLLPEVIDLTFIPALGFLGAVVGGSLTVLFGQRGSVEQRALFGGRWGAAGGVVIAIVIYVAALLGAL